MSTSAPDWFDIKKYEPALRFDFRDWATQIGNRFFLSNLLKHEKFVEFDQSFARIQVNPFDDLGYRGSYPSDKTVYPLTFGVAKTITDVLSDIDCEDKEYCDEKLREIDPELYSNQAMLFVNLKSPRTLLINQFDAWLKTALQKRERGPAISAALTQPWAKSHPVLPYQDLKLWHERHKMLLPSEIDMLIWLDIENSHRDAIRQTRKKAEWVFTDDCYFDLLFSASDAPPSAV